MLRLVFMGSDAIALPLLDWLAGGGGGGRTWCCGDRGGVYSTGPRSRSRPKGHTQRD
ncbi:hypothetical protein [Geminisphaera colitermitum]|uniref:hypothetical protein n=1 Tax=Geminisphaera colitermitum TaxID=1148786 RepID=UPI001E57F0D2|nr:hypothetical protein [Geminisphaera colitermitum]